jgi:hypothetical protein
MDCRGDRRCATRGVVTFAGPPKGMKLTKPAQAMELRSLSPVFYGQTAQG